MHLAPIDWTIIAASIVISFLPAIFFAKRAGSSTAEFFTSGRAAPWWLVGISMVATTFSTDTPNLVTNMVRENGVADNWLWWSFLLTGMMTVFFYARLWRRSSVLTDLEFYEIRYSGRPAGFVRGISRRLPRPLLQLRDHGDRQPRGGQDREHRARLVDGKDAPRLLGHHDLLRLRVGPLGRPRDRLDPVRDHDDGDARDGLVRPEASGGRRPFGTPAQDGREPPGAAAGFLESRSAAVGSRHPADDPVVVGLVPRRGAGRRQLHRAADARVAQREGRADRHALLQRDALRRPALALDPRGARVAPRLSGPRRDPPRVSRTSSRISSATTWPIPRCCVSCRRASSA